MKKLLQYIVSGITDNPKKISITTSKDNQTDITQLLLSVDPEDMGKVIGKQGKIIQAIRNLVRTKAIIEGKKVVLSLKEV